MKIETKFDYKQKVWFMHENKPCESEIFLIDITYPKDLVNRVADVNYHLLVEERIVKGEPEIFATKEELINSL